MLSLKLVLELGLRRLGHPNFDYSTTSIFVSKRYPRSSYTLMSFQARPQLVSCSTVPRTTVSENLSYFLKSGPARPVGLAAIQLCNLWFRMILQLCLWKSINCLPD